MANSESATRESTLATLPRGAVGRVLAVDAAIAVPLAAHGIRPGARLTVERDAPLGGPRVVRLGAARVALARPIAAAIRVARVEGPG